MRIEISKWEEYIEILNEHQYDKYLHGDCKIIFTLESIILSNNKLLRIIKKDSELVKTFNELLEDKSNDIIYRKEDIEIFNTNRGEPYIKGISIRDKEINYEIFIRRSELESILEELKWRE